MSKDNNSVVQRQITGEQDADGDPQGGGGWW